MKMKSENEKSGTWGNVPICMFPILTILKMEKNRDNVATKKLCKNLS